MTDTVTEPFDTERAIAIAQEVRDVITIHDALATRTDDPVFLDLIALSRRWWLRWLAAGLCDVSGLPDCSGLVDAIADTEAKIADRAGPADFKSFAAWAEAQGVSYAEPFDVYPDEAAAA